MTYRTQINSGTIANLPPSGQAGDLYLPTNGIAAYQNNGASWQSWGPLIPTVTPTATNTSFNWVTQGTATQTYNNSGMFVSVLGGSTSIFLVQSNSDTSAGSVEASAVYSIVGAQVTGSTNVYCDWGVVMRNTSNGDFIELYQRFNLNAPTTPQQYLVYGGTNVASTNMISIAPGGPVFLKLAVVSSNIIGSVSRDRVNYLQVFSSSLSTALGSGVTSSTFQTGVNVNTTGNATYTNNVNFIHYTQG